MAARLNHSNQEFTYEVVRIPFVQPEIKRSYTPDFYLPKHGFYLEAKGIFTARDRKKHIWIKEQYPELYLRFVFQNARLPIRRGSKTTCADWCDKKGFKWCHKVLPSDWINNSAPQ